MATLSAIRRVVEEYLISVAPSTPEVGFLTLVPWSSQEKPANVLASCADCGELRLESIAQIVEQHEVVLIVSVYRTNKEKRRVVCLLDHLGAAHPDVAIFLVQLPDRLDPELTKAYLSKLMERYDELHSFGADGVLMELAGDPGGLQHRLSLEFQENAAIQLRVRAQISTLNQSVLSAIQLKGIEDEFRSLLWNAIPRSVTDAREVESIYQEFCFLTHTLDHPHIIRCVGMLHSQRSVQLVLQYGGDVCMEQVLLTQPGYRLSKDEALDCSAQIASALSYCHAQAALNEPYLPKPADCWSLGVLLLETACGQGSLKLSVQWRRGEPIAYAARQVLEFFSHAGSSDRDPRATEQALALAREGARSGAPRDALREGGAGRASRACAELTKGCPIAFTANISLHGHDDGERLLTEPRRQYTPFPVIAIVLKGADNLGTEMAVAVMRRASQATKAGLAHVSDAFYQLGGTEADAIFAVCARQYGVTTHLMLERPKLAREIGTSSAAEIGARFLPLCAARCRAVMRCVSLSFTVELHLKCTCAALEDLIGGLLTVDPARRLGVQECPLRASREVCPRRRREGARGGSAQGARVLRLPARARRALPGAEQAQPRDHDVLPPRRAEEEGALRQGRQRPRPSRQQSRRHRPLQPHHRAEQCGGPALGVSDSKAGASELAPTQATASSARPLSTTPPPSGTPRPGRAASPVHAVGRVAAAAAASAPRSPPR
ncbi:unnamed protein product, partial [Prorocentrum cordatum]